MAFTPALCVDARSCRYFLDISGILDRLYNRIRRHVVRVLGETIDRIPVFVVAFVAGLSKISCIVVRTENHLVARVGGRTRRVVAQGVFEGAVPAGVTYRQAVTAESRWSFERASTRISLPAGAAGARGSVWTEAVLAAKGFKGILER